MSDENANLKDWGGGAVVKPPRVYRKILVERPDTGKIAGFVGRETRRGQTAYTTLRGSSHYYEVGDGYAMSDRILAYLDDVGVTRLFIHDTSNGIEDGDIFEFRLRDYRDDGETVRYAEDADPQSFLPIERHLHKWPAMGLGLYQTDFDRTLDRIDRRVEP